MLSIIFLTYNRSDLLSLAVEAMRQAVETLPRLSTEFIISDDGSSDEHRRGMATLQADRVIHAERNRGLSHNHNQAIGACRGEYILSLQDDWDFVGDPKLILAALEILESDQAVGVVNFIPPTAEIPWLEKSSPGGYRYIVFENDGLPYTRPGASRPYSDRPHLKRASFARDLGPYRDDLPMTRAELDFQMRVATQDRWKVAYLQNDLSFKHLGAERTFNPSILRAQRLEAFYAVPIVGPIYREVRASARALRDRLVTRTRA